jgi:hypothetical protein
MEENLRKELEALLETYQDAPLDVINQKMKAVTDTYNNRGLSDFDGLSPDQMYGLLYQNCNENMIKIKDDTGADIPIIQQIKYYLTLVRENKEIKLTKAGNLPPVIVKDIYSKKYLTDTHIELGISKLTKETDSPTIELTNILQCQQVKTPSGQQFDL